MSTEWIKQIAVRPDGVYLHSKSNNDDIPFRTWRCDSLTEVYNQEGQLGLDREVLRMLCEYAAIQGDHPSMERYRRCLRSAKATELHGQRAVTLNREYAKLTPEDIKTIWGSDERRTPAAETYRQFAQETENAHYTQLAQLAERLNTKGKNEKRRRGNATGNNPVRHYGQGATRYRPPTRF